MANTVSYGTNVITITNDGTLVDYDSTKKFPDGVRIKAIKFKGSGATDVLQVRDSKATGAILTNMKVDSLLQGQDTSFMGSTQKPYIKASENSWQTPGSCIVIIILDGYYFHDSFAE